MKKSSLCIAAALFGLAHVSFVVAEGTQQLSAEQSARPLSAFFGLDNKLPFGANVLCLGAGGDGDNNHFLCLDTTMPATAVAFPAGHLVDPNGDLNADSKVMVRR